MAKAYHHGDLRRTLIDRALAVLAEAGPEALSLRDLARALGVSPAAPYRHFADKQALLFAVAEEVAARFEALVMELRAAAPDNALEQFRAIGVAHVLFAVRHPAHFRIMFEPAMQAHLAAASPAWARLVANEQGLLEAGQANAEVAGLPLPQVRLAASSLVYGLARLLVDGVLTGGRPVTEAEARAMVHDVTGVLGVGLLPRVEPCAPGLPAKRAAARRRPAR